MNRLSRLFAAVPMYDLMTVKLAAAKDKGGKNMYELRRMVVNGTEIVCDTSEVDHLENNCLSVWTARLTGLDQHQVDYLAAALEQPASIEIENDHGDLYVSQIAAVSGISRNDTGAVLFDFVALFRFVPSLAVA